MDPAIKDQIKPFLDTIHDEVSILRSGLPSDQESTLRRLSAISEACDNAAEEVMGKEVRPASDAPPAAPLADAPPVPEPSAPEPVVEQVPDAPPVEQSAPTPTPKSKKGH